MRFSAAAVVASDKNKIVLNTWMFNGLLPVWLSE
jgi:hypothetical protein